MTGYHRSPVSGAVPDCSPVGTPEKDGDTDSPDRAESVDSHTEEIGTKRKHIEIDSEEIEPKRKKIGIESEEIGTGEEETQKEDIEAEKSEIEAVRAAIEAMVNRISKRKDLQVDSEYYAGWKVSIYPRGTSKKRNLGGMPDFWYFSEDQLKSLKAIHAYIKNLEDGLKDGSKDGQQSLINSSYELACGRVHDSWADEYCVEETTVQQA